MPTTKPSTKTTPTPPATSRYGKKSEDSDRSPEEQAANARLLNAQADKELVEIEKARADLRKTLKEIEIGELQRAMMEYNVEQTRINTRMTQDQEREYLAMNKFHHVYHFTKEVGASSVRECMGMIDNWRRTDPSCAFEIVFSSPGGSVIDGMALFDYILQARAAGHVVTTSTLGYAASMAGILLQAGDTRRMGREAYLLIHEISFGAGGKIGEVEDEVAFGKKIQSRIVSIFAERSKLSKKEIEKRWKRKDWWLDSAEALKLGFVDEVR